MNEGQALVETQRELRAMEERAEKAEQSAETEAAGHLAAAMLLQDAEKELAQARQDHSDAELDHDRAEAHCKRAEQVAHEAIARAKKAEAALAAVIAELANYELNGSNAPAQIRGIYSDLETVSHEYRVALKSLASARAVMAEEAARWFGDMYPSRHDADQIRALAPLPPGMLMLPVEHAKVLVESDPKRLEYLAKGIGTATLIGKAWVALRAALSAAGGEATEPSSGIKAPYSNWDVAQFKRAAIFEEREACAKVAEEYGCLGRQGDADGIANEIRARGSR